MNDNVIITLIIAAVIVVALVIFRHQLKRLIVDITIGPSSVKANLETHKPVGTGDPAHHVTASKPAGPSQTATATGSADVSDIDQKMAGAVPGMKQGVAGEGQAQISGVTQDMKAAGPKAEQAVQAKDNARVKNARQEM
jgi:hypothetical protein